MAHRHGQSHPTTTVGNAEILAQIEQSKREALLKRIAYEVGAPQLHPIPTPPKAGGQQLKGRRFDPKANLDEAVQSYGSDLAHRNRFAAKVIGNAGYVSWKRRNQPGRHHDHRRSLTLAIIACNASNPGKQNVSGFGGRFVRENNAPLVVAGHRQCFCQLSQDMLASAFRLRTLRACGDAIV